MLPVYLHPLSYSYMVTSLSERRNFKSIEGAILSPHRGVICYVSTIYLADPCNHARRSFFLVMISLTDRGNYTNKYRVLI